MLISLLEGNGQLIPEVSLRALRNVSSDQNEVSVFLLELELSLEVWDSESRSEDSVLDLGVGADPLGALEGDRELGVVSETGEQTEDFLWKNRIGFRGRRCWHLRLV